MPVTTTPKVTVCLPTYNRAGYLASCLTGILGQTFRDFEVLVSDNCSTDATPDVVQACADPRIRYHRNEMNIGVFPNMNRCLAQARGEYVCILHDDDVYSPRFLEREVELLDRYPTAGLVHCAAYEIDARNLRRRLIRAYPQDCLREGKQEFLRYLGGHNICCSTVMARRRLYQDMGGFDPSYLCSDFFMWLQFALQADIAYVAAPLVAMRVHDCALSSSIEPARWCREYLALMERGLKLADSACPSLLRERGPILRRAIRAQGKRFFVMAMGAVTAGEQQLAGGYVDVLRQLESRGLSPAYARGASLLNNRIGRLALSLVRRFWRAGAVKRLPQESPWWGAPAPAVSTRGTADQPRSATVESIPGA